MNEYLKYIPAVLLAIYLVLINIIAVCVTIKDKNIAVANGKLEAQATKGRSTKNKNSSGKKTSSAKKGGKKTAAKISLPAPQRRVPEKTLLLISALGGSVAMLVTMRTIRHKTQHMKFMVGIPLIIVAQSVLAAALVWLLLR